MAKLVAELVELYRKYRPQKFSEVVGQTEAVSILNSMVRENKVPHALLLSGPTGSGKTTCARIMKQKMGCEDIDFDEINAASSRGIGTVREIEDKVGISPWGKCRVILLDECHQLSRKEGGDAQTALLKVVEDCPDHAYFFFCTTNPSQLLDTLRGRCTSINLGKVSDADILRLLDIVCGKENTPIDKNVLEQIVEVCDGSPRMALNLLGKVLHLKDPKQQLAVLLRSDVKRSAWDLTRALVYQSSKWSEISQIIQNLNSETSDLESIRHMILTCANKELLKGGPKAARAFLIISIFGNNWFDCKEAGLSACCWEVFHNKD